MWSALHIYPYHRLCARGGSVRVATVALESIQMDELKLEITSYRAAHNMDMVQVIAYTTQISSVLARSQRYCSTRIRKLMHSGSPL